MRRLTILAAVVSICFVVTLHAQEKNAKPPTDQGSDLPYKVKIGSVTPGNQAFAEKVLWIYKYYEDNTIDKIADMLAEDVVASFPDGTIVQGKKKLINAYKDARSRFTASEITIDACVTLKSPDVPDREAVSIWATETGVLKDRTIIKLYGNEVYSFNSDGKVVEVRSMTAKINQ